MNLIKPLLWGICLVLIFSCAGIEKTPITSPEVYPVKTPVAGNYPQGLYKYPLRAISLANESFTQTLNWNPKVNKTFDKDTQYTATLILEPVNKRHTLKDVVLADVKGLPTEGVEFITVDTSGDCLVIEITFNKTASEYAEPALVFVDEFDGNNLDPDKWDLCPEWDRAGRSTWKDDMVSVSGGLLRLKFIRDTELAKKKSQRKELADNWIRAGAIRTRTKGGHTLFENTYGYYESRIKFPVVRGTWGGFWLMSPTEGLLADEGVDGTEIDIVETLHNDEGRYNAALNWNGYGRTQKAVYGSNSSLPEINIYDGEFHIFALDWSPSEYVFYVDGKVLWRVDGGAEFKNSGINQNPNYIKLSVEGADWRGPLPTGFNSDEMLVDYVKVYNQPLIRP